MVWGILGALDEEVALIRDSMQVARSEDMLGTTFHIGTAFGKQIVLACCGIGKVNAAVCAATLIQRFGADCVINVGIAGAMARGLQVLDVVVGREAGFHDQDATMLKYYPQREFFATDEALLALCTRACETLAQTYTVGRIMSGDVFVSNKETKERIVSRYAPACVEMEGASIGHTAYMHGKPFLIIRTMSDTAEDDAHDIYDDFMHRAAQQSAHIILKMLEIG